MCVSGSVATPKLTKTQSENSFHKACAWSLVKAILGCLNSRCFWKGVGSLVASRQGNRVFHEYNLEFVVFSSLKRVSWWSSPHFARAPQIAVTNRSQVRARPSCDAGLSACGCPEARPCWRLGRACLAAQRPDVLGLGLAWSFAQRPDMLEAGACLLGCPEARRAGAGACQVVCPEARHAEGWCLSAWLPRGQTCLRLGPLCLVAQRPDVLEAGACAVVCPEARHAGGWGLFAWLPRRQTCWRLGLGGRLPRGQTAGSWGLSAWLPRGQTCWRLGLARSFAQRPDVLEAGACLPGCTEASRAGGWGLLRCFAQRLSSAEH
jgi:hypothetical protein